MPTTSHVTGQLRYRNWDEIGRDLRAALDQVAALGVRWQGTRFDHYLRLIERYAAMPKQPDVLDRLEAVDVWEALKQTDQLTEAAALFPRLEREILVEKLATVMSGADVHVDPDRDDLPRNTLFELMAGRILTEVGFSIELTRDAEDLIASHPRLQQKVSVECKRPAYCSTPKEVTARMVKNLVRLRRQLLTRDRRNIRMGVVGMDGVYRMRDHIASGTDHESIGANLRAGMGKAVNDIQAVNRARRLNLESGMQMCALILLGLGQDRDGRGHALRLTRIFFLGRSLALERAMAGVAGVDWPVR